MAMIQRDVAKLQELLEEKDRRIDELHETLKAVDHFNRGGEVEMYRYSTSWWESWLEKGSPTWADFNFRIKKKIEHEWQWLYKASGSQYWHTSSYYKTEDEFRNAYSANKDWEFEKLEKSKREKEI